MQDEIQKLERQQELEKQEQAYLGDLKVRPTQTSSPSVSSSCATPRLLQ